MYKILNMKSQISSIRYQVFYTYQNKFQIIKIKITRRTTTIERNKFLQEVASFMLIASESKEHSKSQIASNI